MTTADRLFFIDMADVDIVLARIPPTYLDRLRDVSLFGDSKGGRRLGFVTTYGRRDVNLCALLPIRISMRELMRRGSSALDFGAPERGQWPPWAVRRLLLYSVLLHEIGHIQEVQSSSRMKRRFASERISDAFANELRGQLYSTPFDHIDPIHNAPSDAELAMLPWWERLNKEERARLALWICGDSRAPDSLDIDLDPAHAAFIARARVRRLRPARRDRPLRSQRSTSVEVGADRAPEKIVKRVTRPIEIRLAHDDEPLP